MDDKEYEESKEKVTDYESLNSHLRQVNTLLDILSDSASYVTAINISVPGSYADKNVSRNLCLTVPVLHNADPDINKFPDGIKESLVEMLTESKERLESEMEDL